MPQMKKSPSACLLALTVWMLAAHTEAHAMDLRELNQYLSNIGTSVVSGSLTLEKGSSSPVVAGKNVQLNGTVVEGSVTAGRHVSGQGCMLNGKIRAGGSVSLKDCAEVQEIVAGKNVSLSGTRVNRDIKAGDHLILEDSQVFRNALSGGDVRLLNSMIHGELGTGGKHIQLENSTVQEIRAYGDGHTSSSVISNVGILSQSVIGNNSSIIQNQHGHRAMVSMGNQGLSSINGYTVKSQNNQTTVMTPEGAIFVNGQKVSGNGPDDYTEYQALHTDAPNVQGPGWGASAAHSSAHSSRATLDTILDTITVELSGNSSVLGDIRFERIPGKVILHPGSKVQGNIYGGSVQRL